MFRWCCPLLIACFAVLLFASTALADQRVGQLLADALKTRETGTVSDVSTRFLAAAGATTNPKQRGEILFLLSDYLLEHREWNRAIPVQHLILEQGEPGNRPGALYNLIGANLEIGRQEEAREAAVELNACPEGGTMREHARLMHQLSPHGSHSRISDLLLATSAVSGPPQTVWKGSAEERPTLSSGGPAQPHSWSPQSWPNPADAPYEVPASPWSGSYAPRSEPQSSSEPRSSADRENPVRIRWEVGGWQSDLEGDLESRGTSVDFGNDLDTKRQTSLVLGAEATLSPKDRIKISYANFSFSGNSTRTLVHDSKTYTRGAAFTLRSKFADLEGFRAWQEHSGTSWGWLYGVMFTNSEFQVTQNVLGVRQVSTWESRFAYPYLGLAGRSNSRGNIGWDASIKWFSWPGDGFYNTHDLELRLLLGKGVGRKSDAGGWWGYLGYRDLRWSGDFESESGGIHFSGPIFGLEFAL